ncbi:hypothetical protein RHSIM_Rhsim09G0007700 [Rhododendron simsii]|uniref:Uncharacterized protein n=1 Tax=Rhododendron simsii TaxID=118357 RepID=A0A834LFR1_RHOSS|nr:hypothetical protein RHSIM_Rhsim09G0007700 [Rhododendron simsii]
MGLYECQCPFAEIRESNSTWKILSNLFRSLAGFGRDCCKHLHLQKELDQFLHLKAKEPPANHVISQLSAYSLACIFVGLASLVNVNSWFLIGEKLSRDRVEDALAHPYLTLIHDVSDEPICMTPFNFDFKQHALTEKQTGELIDREALAFNRSISKCEEPYGTLHLEDVGFGCNAIGDAGVMLCFFGFFETRCTTLQNLRNLVQHRGLPRTSSAVSAGNAEAVVQFSAGILLIVLVLDVGFASNAK